MCDAFTPNKEITVSLIATGATEARGLPGVHTNTPSPLSDAVHNRDPSTNVSDRRTRTGKTMYQGTMRKGLAQHPQDVLSGGKLLFTFDTNTEEREQFPRVPKATQMDI
jgi:hypothetical protein